ncbi:hypothetical protein QFC21_005088 [Naganishia friedmannii]|uniref:Uncharacterized protein n=1 Tax=Naganishia friedmannii TaxID=89922 RepID=A0ACC2VBZ0_9TREE|nr:hypothetical protein QFC21_005088 [Naganishia friedmannii]
MDRFRENPTEILSFGAATLAVEVRTPTEEQKMIIQKYASFMHSYLGRGVFYLLVGILMLNYYTLLYISGSVVAACGLVYIGLHFMPMVEPPSTMRPPPPSADIESEPVWQAPN